MTLLSLGLVVFFTAHLYAAFRTRVEGRDIKTRLGKGPYMGLYSLVAAIGLALIIYGYGRAPDGELLYVGPAWARPLGLVAMALALTLLVAAYLPRGHIRAGARHPMVVGTTLWAASHLAVGADLKALLLFGSFGLFGVVDFLAASARARPEAAAEAPRLRNDLIAIAGGLAVYALFLGWAHQALFGVTPW